MLIVCTNSTEILSQKKTKIICNTFFYLVTLAYDGSDFFGWARQDNKPTVQGYIEDTLSRVFNRKINILASSRTDRGVHAHDQKFVLRLPFFLPSKSLFVLLKKVLSSVQIKKLKKVDSDFHPLRDVLVKEYRYLIGTEFDIFRRKYCWEYSLPLEVSRLKNILKIFVGTHNFFNFCYCRIKDKTKTDTVRSISSIRVVKKEQIVISFRAKSFLRYQIRVIVGEAISCYEGTQSLVDLERRLNTEQIDKYRFIAPASGLYLWSIKFKQEKDI